MRPNGRSSADCAGAYQLALAGIDGETYVFDLTIDDFHPTPAGYLLITSIGKYAKADPL
jgi:hypothetical protein